MRRTRAKTRRPPPVYDRIRQILEAARTGISRTVNTTQVVANWLIGREIVEEEQQGKRRAGYGDQLIAELSECLQADFGRGFALRNLETFRQFYLQYAQLVEIPHAVRAESGARSIPHALRALSVAAIEAQTTTRGCTLRSGTERDLRDAPRGKSGMPHTVCDQSLPAMLRPSSAASWHPGLLHPNLSWTHYRTLLRVEKPAARSFYEIEAVRNNWSARELERQINSLLFERLALSRDKKGVLRLAGRQL